MAEPTASLDASSREIGMNQRRAGGKGTELEKDLSRVDGKKWLRRIGILLGIAALVGAFLVYRAKTRPKPPPRYVTAQLSKGDVFETVQSTGQVQPLTQVQVGAQVSGRVTKVY